MHVHAQACRSIVFSDDVITFMNTKENNRHVSVHGDLGQWRHSTSLYVNIYL